MRLLINVHMHEGEVRRDIFFETMEEVAEYINELREESVPFRKVVVYDAVTKEAIKIYTK